MLKSDTEIFYTGTRSLSRNFVISTYLADDFEGRIVNYSSLM